MGANTGTESNFVARAKMLFYAFFVLLICYLSVVPSCVRKGYKMDDDVLLETESKYILIRDKFLVDVGVLEDSLYFSVFKVSGFLGFNYFGDFWNVRDFNKNRPILWETATFFLDIKYYPESKKVFNVKLEQVDYFMLYANGTNVGVSHMDFKVKEYVDRIITYEDGSVSFSNLGRVKNSINNVDPFIMDIVDMQIINYSKINKQSF